ncbi:MAG: NAD(P)H-hydrate epimerase [Fidelibacterota bacterium]
MNKVSLPAITADQMREVDRLMIEEYKISLEQMMESAGRNLADLALRLLDGLGLHNIVVTCGGGNNGGGGMVAARYLYNRGVQVTVILATPPSKLKTIPKVRWLTLKKLPIKIILADISNRLEVFYKSNLIIDAIIGYGLYGEPRGVAAHVLDEINRSGNTQVLSLDVPSGLDSTTGKPYKSCIRACATMTLALPKKGLLTPGAKDYTGQLYLADIGVPPGLYEQLGLSPQVLFSEDSILTL